jgi:hypothetical protein
MVVSGIKKGFNGNEHSKGIFHHKNLAFKQEGNGDKMGPNTTFPPTCILEVQKISNLMKMPV